MTGIVYKSTGSWYTVKAEDGVFYECRIKGKFRLKGIKSTNPISVGDTVDFKLDDKHEGNFGVIDNIHNRTNYIVRKSVNLSKQTHIIASNIDQVFLLITIDNPPTFTIFIDRFLVTAQAYSIKAVLLFNKIDTYDEDTLLEVRYLAHLYRSVGYECIGISAKPLIQDMRIIHGLLEFLLMFYLCKNELFQVIPLKYDLIITSKALILLLHDAVPKSRFLWVHT